MLHQQTTAIQKQQNVQSHCGNRCAVSTPSQQNHLVTIPGNFTYKKNYQDSKTPTFPKMPFLSSSLRPAKVIRRIRLKTLFVAMSQCTSKKLLQSKWNKLISMENIGRECFGRFQLIVIYIYILYDLLYLRILGRHTWRHTRQAPQVPHHPILVHLLEVASRGCEETGPGHIGRRPKTTSWKGD